MKVKSFIRQGWRLIPAEVEVILVPGIPQIEIIGLPDRIIKESALRIKTAIRAQGFEFPRAKQVIVHLKPSHLKKTALGLDLAIAAALLMETGQISIPIEQDLYFYGEVSLRGEVVCPEDFEDIRLRDFNSPVIMGFQEKSNQSGLMIKNLGELKELARQMSEAQDFKIENQFAHSQWIRPPLDLGMAFDQTAARLLTIIALGEHSVLFAGPQGTGKTTMCKSIFPLLANPEEEVFIQSQMIARQFAQHLTWRPFASPHHTTSALAMVGGGIQARPGEISRAHGGVLLLDEYLEFNPKVQEALREPFEEGVITISRNSKCEIYPARALILATTNLCQCGLWVPDKSNNCQCAGTRLKQYRQRLSGPVLDRFQMVCFSHHWRGEKTYTLQNISAMLSEPREFKMQLQQKLAGTGQTREVQARVMDGLNSLGGGGGSQRRTQAILKVAATIADLEQSAVITTHHFEESLYCTWRTFELLKNPIL